VTGISGKRLKVHQTLSDNFYNCELVKSALSKTLEKSARRRSTKP